MIYTKTQIELLSQALMRNKRALLQLQQTNEEFYMLHRALLGDLPAIEWLMKNNKVLAAFDSATGGNRTAVKFLIGQKEIAWAAVANYLQGDESAIGWLQKNKLDHFIQLAYSIKKMLKREQGSGVSFLFKP